MVERTIFIYKLALVVFTQIMRPSCASAIEQERRLAWKLEIASASDLRAPNATAIPDMDLS
jgi:hypothetical protein